MDTLQQIKDKLQEMVAKYNQNRDDEENPNHSDGYGMYWSGVFSCLKELIHFTDSITNEPSPKIKGWVARDDDMNHIHLFHNKPLRSKWTWACGYPSLQLPDELFPDLKWEDEPIEVELIVNRV